MKILIEVKLKSKNIGVEKVSEKHFIVRTNKEAKDNKANNDIILQLAKYFKVSKNSIEIRVGKTTKNKIVEIIKSKW